jgi:hypothetical protein
MDFELVLFCPPKQVQISIDGVPGQGAGHYRAESRMGIKVTITAVQITGAGWN